VPAFPLVRIAGALAAAPGGLGIPHGQQKSQIDPLLHNKTGPSKIGDVVSSPGP